MWGAVVDRMGCPAEAEAVHCPVFPVICDICQNDTGDNCPYIDWELCDAEIFVEEIKRTNVKADKQKVYAYEHAQCHEVCGCITKDILGECFLKKQAQ